MIRQPILDCGELGEIKNGVIPESGVPCFRPDLGARFGGVRLRWMLLILDYPTALEIWAVFHLRSANLLAFLLAYASLVLSPPRRSIGPTRFGGLATPLAHAAPHDIASSRLHPLARKGVR
jgi:hypothetical protein